MWSLKTLLRYVFLQLPIPVLLGVIYLISRQYDSIPSQIILIVLAVWLIKDIILYPLVWKAYQPHNIEESESMQGLKGKALTDVNPTGRVEVRGEIWQARVVKERNPVIKNDTVRIVRVQNLTLIVESWVKG